MISADKVLKNMRLTEKASKLSSNYGQYVFEVYPSETGFIILTYFHANRQWLEKTFEIGKTIIASG